jgi:hypothetical protein
MLPIAPNEPRRVSIPGSSAAAMFFSSTSSVCWRAVWISMVERRSSLESEAGSTFDIWRIVIPTQMTRKAMTIVRI